MAEGFDPSDAPTTRGRRRPEIAEAMLQDDNQLADAGQDASDMRYVGLAPGDTVVAKVSWSADTATGEAWYTFGATSTVLENETADGAAERLAEVVNTNALALADDFAVRQGEAIESMAERQREEMRGHRIPSTRQ